MITGTASMSILIASANSRNATVIFISVVSFIVQTPIPSPGLQLDPVLLN